MSVTPRNNTYIEIQNNEIQYYGNVMLSNSAGI